MADKEPEEPAKVEELSEEELAAKAKKKKLITFGGGFLGLILTAWIAATLAVPGRPEVRYFEGPFVSPLSDEEEWEIQVNLNRGAFLSMELIAEYFAYDEGYFAARIADEHYKRTAKNALIGLATQKTESELLDRASNLIFLEEVRLALEPILFPVHLGDAVAPFDPDSESGLRPGLSHLESTFRGPIYEHKLVVDAVEKTMRVDDGPAVTFEGHESDLAVPTPDGARIHVDVTRLDPEFVGEIQVGVYGQVRTVLKDKFLIQ